MKHFYQEIDGWFDFQNIYSWQIALVGQKAHFVEVGAWLGKSAAFMAVDIINSRKQIRFDVVDNWKGLTGDVVPQAMRDDGVYESFLRNMEPVKEVIHPIRLSSLEAVEQYQNDSLDFVFIDASHEYNDVRADISKWWSKIKFGGYLAGHDMQHPGVNRAVREAFKRRFKKFNTSWVVQKIDPRQRPFARI
jgi:predicted O-methyltransferase YrrM